MSKHPSAQYAGGGTAAGDPLRGHASQDTRFFGHPLGLSTLFFTELWERFSYYGIRPLLVLFMTAAVTTGGFALPREQASAIVGIYAASVYLASLPGGWVADRLLGLRRAIFWGGVLIALGHLSIGFSAFLGRGAFFVGLILIVLGTGLLKPNISAIVGDLYPEGGARRDAGFSIFYMGINIGALVAPLITGFLGEDQERFGWHYGFGAAGVGMVIGLIYYSLTAQKTLGNIGTEPTRHPDPAVDARQRRNMTIGLGIFLGILALVVVMGMSGMLNFNPVTVAENMSYVMLTMAVVYFAYLFLAGGLTRDEMKRVAVIIVLFVFAVIFWAAFEQAPTSLTLFAADFTDRTIGGWEMPVTWLQAANSFFVIALAPVFAAIWVGLARRRGDLSSPAKFTLGLVFAAMGFGLMILAANTVLAGGPGTKVAVWWLIGSYFLQTVGELCLSPVGLSSMTKLAPRKFSGQMMGVWFMAAALGNLIAGIVGGHVNPENPQDMPALFTRTTLSLLIAAAVLAALIIPIRRMMREVPANETVR
ncbi:peptide MFS transporter [Longimicrobium terrae]|uniref:POT family proton-dependent oligopeptide transporter n=1 Tax=Longimicrobium terrae TaxID=1639882 RepID=A0A841H5M7_9BACT|nr:peptide MFS transporter [Longimicrobium terrae]MBB4639121.1 POT family proton-dependent oligopeptide transporter [Longimicrobium terrae]MBB6073278.1 POT family proton-dependent oligopeptide transporter [Longimicrobium terrae]NNC28719.1 peptide MFS transporter [Longimicrobium terrae]